jgi:hypothetical protein
LVARTPLNVTLYVYCQSGCKYILCAPILTF